MNELELHDKKAFEEIFAMIKESRVNLLKTVNKGLIDLYWNIG